MTTGYEMVTDSQETYPIRYNVVRPEHQSRITNFPLWIGTFIRMILLIPHFIILYFFQLAGTLVYFIATFAILFTGRYPEGMRVFYVGYLRWAANVYGYLGHLYDDYPPFTMDPTAYPLTFEADAPASLSRIMNAPILGLIIKVILAIPHLVVLTFLLIIAYVVIFIANFAVLFTGSFPVGMHSFIVGVGRWYMRVSAYIYALTDKYPPFSSN